MGVKFKQHKINHFQVYTLVTFLTFTVWGNDHIILLFFSQNNGEYGREASGRQEQDLTYSTAFLQRQQPLHLVAPKFVH